MSDNKPLQSRASQASSSRMSPEPSSARARTKPRLAAAASTSTATTVAPPPRPAAASARQPSTSSFSVAANATRPAASANSNSSSGASTSAAERHAAYLASLAARREVTLHEARRRKVDKRVGESAASHVPVADRLTRDRDTALAQHMPRVISILGASAVECVRREFIERRGWIENPNEYSGVWSVQWCVVSRVLDHSSLRPNQIVNHFARASCITSKQGLCANVHSLRHAASADPNDFFPRAFELHVYEAELCAEFRSQFRAQACWNLAGRFVRAWESEHGLEGEKLPSDALLAPPQPVAKFDSQMLQLVLIGIQAHLRTLQWQLDGLDNSLPTLPPAGMQSEIAHSDDGVAMQAWANLTEREWMRVEQTVERMEEADRRYFAQQARSRNTNATAPAESQPVVPNGDSLDKQSNEHEPQANDAEEDGFDDAATEESAPSPPSSLPPFDDYPQPSPDSTKTAAQTGHDEEEQEPSVERLTLLQREPIPLSQLYSHFRALSSLHRRLDPQHYSLLWPAVRNLWILKPGGLSRGRGIRVVRRWSEVLSVLRSGGRWVVQSYIERPLLVHGKKFDVRQWVLLSCFNNVYCVWFYTAGCYLRFSSADFSLFDDDPIVHLTNNSVQKESERFGELEFAKGNMWSVQQFCTWLSSERARLVSELPHLSDCLSGDDIWSRHIQPSMQRIARLVVAASQEQLELRSNSFTLFGLDYMLSSDLRPWILEVNSSPTLVGIAVPGLVESMVRDLADIIEHDANSPISDEWRKRVQAEKERMQAEREKMQAENEQAAAAASSNRSGQKAAVGKAGPLKKVDSSPVPRASSAPLPPNGSKSPSNATAVVAEAESDPFVLPIPPPVGHRVGGWEVLEASFVGTIPKAFRKQQQEKPPAQSNGVTPSQPAASSLRSGDGANESDKKIATSPSNGLFVQGKAIPLLAAAVTARTARPGPPSVAATKQKLQKQASIKQFTRS